MKTSVRGAFFASMPVHKNSFAFLIVLVRKAITQQNSLALKANAQDARCVLWSAQT